MAACWPRDLSTHHGGGLSDAWGGGLWGGLDGGASLSPGGGLSRAPGGGLFDGPGGGLYDGPGERHYRAILPPRDALLDYLRAEEDWYILEILHKVWDLTDDLTLPPAAADRVGAGS